MDGRKNNGGARKGAGRPATGQRPSHTVCVFPGEWEVVKRFVKCVKKDAQKTEKFLLTLEDEIEKAAN